MQWDGTNPIRKQKSEKISPKIPPKAARRPNDLLSGRLPNQLPGQRAGPCTPASACANQATPELTETATDTLNSATPMALEVKHFSLNITLTTGLDFQELTVDTDSNVTPAHSFGANDDK